MPAVARKTSQKISALNNDPTNTFGAARETNTISELPGKIVALKKALKNINHKPWVCQKSAKKLKEKMSHIRL